LRKHFLLLAFILIFWISSANTLQTNSTISVTNASIAVINHTTNVSVVIDFLPHGLSGYNISVSLSNSSIAEIIYVEFPAWATMHLNSSLPSTSIQIKAADINEKIGAGNTNTILANLTLKGKHDGISFINISRIRIDDDDGYPITVMRQNAILTVGANYPPTKPSLSYPPDESTNIGITTTLTWHCSDADNNSLTYDVYFGITSNLTKVASNITATSYNPSNLQYSTTYKWCVVAWDEHGAKNESKIWHFTTQPIPQYTLTTNVDPSNGGYIALNPSGGMYDEGTVITATANANSGYQFDHWSGDASGTNPTIQITMDSNKSITAHFVETTPPNQPPTVAITFPANGSTISGTVNIAGTASDADGTVQSVQVNIDTGSWINATGTTSWSYSWDTTTVANGSHTIYARSYDGTNYSSIDSVTVNIPPNQRPAVTITYPYNNQEVKGTITIRGTASDSDGSVQRVEVRIDSGSWHTASGTTSWHYSWNTESVGDGSHTIYARSYDGKDYSSYELINYNVKNKKSGGGIPGFEMVALIVALGAVMWVKRRRK